MGTVTSLDASAKTITVKDDKSGVEAVVSLTDTKTLIKVSPGAKDLKSGTRITAEQLAKGDRVDVRGSKPADSPDRIAARSLILMSARDLQAAHQVQAAEWQNATAGTVSSIDATGGKVMVNQHTPTGPKALTMTVSGQTEFTRYSPEHPNTPAASSLAELQPGDQVRVIGDEQGGEGTIAAKRIYSGSFRTLNGTVVSVSPDGKQLAIKDLASHKPVDIALNENSSVQKIPAEMSSRPGLAARPREVSEMLERLPKISANELKPGEAVVVSGVGTGGDSDRLTATHVIAGVEPFLRSAPTRQHGSQQTLGGDWGLGEISVPQ